MPLRKMHTAFYFPTCKGNAGHVEQVTKIVAFQIANWSYCGGREKVFTSSSNFAKAG